MKKIILWLFYAYLILFPLGQLLRIPPQSTELVEVHFFLTDVAVASIVVLWLGWKWFKKSKFLVPPLSKPIFLFVVCCLLSLLVNTSLLSGREEFIAGLYLVRWVVYAGLYFVIYDLTRKIGNWKLEIGNLLIYSGVVAAVFGLLQYIFLPDTRFLEKYGWDPHLYRVIGTFFDPGFLGAILVLTLILIVTLNWDKQSLLLRNRRNRMLILAGIIVYFALALTYSRASYLAYLAGMGTIAWFKKSPKFFLTVFLVGVLTVFLLPRPEGEGVRLERESTIKYRIINWEQSLTIAQKNPVFGVGFNAYRYAQRRYGFLKEPEWQLSHAGAGADSSLLFILATTGIVGTSFYLWLWWKILKTGDLIILASAFALLVHSTFVNSLLYPWIMAWMWIILAI
ncbi:hypothetical protein COU95_00825 [Candidatus Shapirobacteria bacterium CG10_big_fil_rev_8_21_14_0_10_40_9]|uniref:O-antigen ligase-related domain-containing protein n=1 Tax=Candidatus Shapirobacteria bacterium CG10_big_fil_rev_8_21_14_0_10_40_9 TaxID=1974888 RepID=A0A2M8L4B2_9BACT|nr:MAG: hypothetical protein COU95_00825 [Candidatus Shapirobacteria bacterium CG10_big_fil_rev_8_21_14_0_10_40_9]